MAAWQVKSPTDARGKPRKTTELYDPEDPSMDDDADESSSYLEDIAIAEKFKPYYDAPAGDDDDDDVQFVIDPNETFSSFLSAGGGAGGELSAVKKKPTGDSERLPGAGRSFLDDFEFNPKSKSSDGDKGKAKKQPVITIDEDEPEQIAVSDSDSDSDDSVTVTPLPPCPPPPPPPRNLTFGLFDKPGQLAITAGPTSMPATLGLLEKPAQPPASAEPPTSKPESLELFNKPGPIGVSSTEPSAKPDTPATGLPIKIQLGPGHGLLKKPPAARPDQPQPAKPAFFWRAKRLKPTMRTAFGSDDEDDTKKDDEKSTEPEKTDSKDTTEADKDKTSNAESGKKEDKSPVIAKSKFLKPKDDDNAYSPTQEQDKDNSTKGSAISASDTAAVITEPAEPLEEGEIADDQAPKIIKLNRIESIVEPALSVEDTPAEPMKIIRLERVEGIREQPRIIQLHRTPTDKSSDRRRRSSERQDHSGDGGRRKSSGRDRNRDQTKSNRDREAHRLKSNRDVEAERSRGNRDADVDRSKRTRGTDEDWSKSARDVSKDRSKSSRDTDAEWPKSSKDVRLPKSSRDLDTGRSKSSRDADAERSKSSKDVHVRLSKTSRDMDAERPKSNTDADIRLSKSSRVLDTDRSKGILDTGAKRSKSSKDADIRLSKSSRELDSDRSKSNRDKDAERSKSSKDIDVGLLKSGRDVDADRYKSSRDVNTDLLRSSWDVVAEHRSKSSKDVDTDRSKNIKDRDADQCPKRKSLDLSKGKQLPSTRLDESEKRYDRKGSDKESHSEKKDKSHDLRVKELTCHKEEKRKSSDYRHEEWTSTPKTKEPSYSDKSKPKDSSSSKPDYDQWSPNLKQRKETETKGKDKKLSKTDEISMIKKKQKDLDVGIKSSRDKDSDLSRLEKSDRGFSSEDRKRKDSDFTKVDDYTKQSDSDFVAISSKSKKRREKDPSYSKRKEPEHSTVDDFSIQKDLDLPRRDDYSSPSKTKKGLSDEVTVSRSFKDDLYNQTSFQDDSAISRKKKKGDGRKSTSSQSQKEVYRKYSGSERVTYDDSTKYTSPEKPAKDAGKSLEKKRDRSSSRDRTAKTKDKSRKLQDSVPIDLTRDVSNGRHGKKRRHRSESGDKYQSKHRKSSRDRDSRSRRRSAEPFPKESTRSRSDNRKRKRSRSRERHDEPGRSKQKRRSRSRQKDDPVGQLYVATVKDKPSKHKSSEKKKKKKRKHVKDGSAVNDRHRHKHSRTRKHRRGSRLRRHKKRRHGSKSKHKKQRKSRRPELDRSDMILPTAEPVRADPPAESWQHDIRLYESVRAEERLPFDMIPAPESPSTSTSTSSSSSSSIDDGAGSRLSSGESSPVRDTMNHSDQPTCSLLEMCMKAKYGEHYDSVLQAMKAARNRLDDDDDDVEIVEAPYSDSDNSPTTVGRTPRRRRSRQHRDSRQSESDGQNVDNCVTIDEEEDGTSGADDNNEGSNAPGTSPVKERVPQQTPAKEKAPDTTAKTPVKSATGPVVSSSEKPSPSVTSNSSSSVRPADQALSSRAGASITSVVTSMNQPVLSSNSSALPAATQAMSVKRITLPPMPQLPPKANAVPSMVSPVVLPKNIVPAPPPTSQPSSGTGVDKQKLVSEKSGTKAAGSADTGAGTPIQPDKKSSPKKSVAASDKDSADKAKKAIKIVRPSKEPTTEEDSKKEPERRRSHSKKTTTPVKDIPSERVVENVPKATPDPPVSTPINRREKMITEPEIGEKEIGARSVPETTKQPSGDSELSSTPAPDSTPVTTPEIQPSQQSSEKKTAAGMAQGSEEKPKEPTLPSADKDQVDITNVASVPKTPTIGDTEVSSRLSPGKAVVASDARVETEEKESGDDKEETVKIPGLMDDSGAESSPVRNDSPKKPEPEPISDAEKPASDTSNKSSPVPQTKEVDLTEMVLSAINSNPLPTPRPVSVTVEAPKPTASDDVLGPVPFLSQNAPPRPGTIPGICEDMESDRERSATNTSTVSRHPIVDKLLPVVDSSASASLDSFPSPDQSSDSNDSTSMPLQSGDTARPTNTSGVALASALLTGDTKTSSATSVSVPSVSVVSGGGIFPKSVGLPSAVVAPLQTPSPLLSPHSLPFLGTPRAASNQLVSPASSSLLSTPGPVPPPSSTGDSTMASQILASLISLSTRVTAPPSTPAAATATTESSKTREYVPGDDDDALSPLSDEIMSFSPPSPSRHASAVAAQQHSAKPTTTTTNKPAEKKQRRRRAKEKKSQSSSTAATSTGKNNKSKPEEQHVPTIRKTEEVMRIAEEFKHILVPHYVNGRITKDEYKEIMRKAVPQICQSKSGDTSKKRMTRYAEAYVTKMILMRKYLAKKNMDKIISGTRRR